MRDEKLKKRNIELLEEFFGDSPFKDFAFKLWDGTVWKPEGAGEPVFTVILNHPKTLANMLVFPVDRRLGESYIYGEFDVEGDMIALFSMETHIERKYKQMVKRPAFWGKIISLLNAKVKFQKLHSTRKAARLRGKIHSIERDKQAISYHYDVSNEFYSLWLDELMNYSCAYFRDWNEDIHTAQKNKLELICRKLRLREGEKVLDIGCGWGGFLIYAAQKYGIKGYGITLSKNQYEYANEKIKELGLQDRIRVDYRDYREMEEWASFDKIVSIGMFEHVGKEMLEEYFRRAYKLLKHGGLFLNHGITRRKPRKTPARWSFSATYIFPDGELQSISHTLAVAEKVGFEVRDVENLREHYAKTLWHWAKRLEENREKALQYVDEVVYRTWRMFLTGSSYGFKSELFGLHQALLVKNFPDGSNNLPINREDLYRNW